MKMMKLMKHFSGRPLYLWMPCLLSLLLAGCGSMQVADPVNPKHPYVFPGQSGTAVAATQPAAAPTVATQPAATQPAPIEPAIAPAPTGVGPSVAPTMAQAESSERLSATKPLDAGPPTLSQPIQPTQRIGGMESPATQPAPVLTAPSPASSTPAISTKRDGMPSNGALAAGSSTVLRPGDNLVISFSDLPSDRPLMPINTELGEDGKITLHHNVTVNALGKTTRALEQEIRAEYVPKLYNYLTVTVRTEMRFIHVSGEVKMPGQYPWRGETTVLRCIGQAGWFTDWARQTKVQLTRTDGTKAIINCAKAQKNVSMDLPVFPGDYINVPRRGWWGW